MTKSFIKQQEILDKSLDKNIYAFFCEPGTGKTFMAIKTAEHWTDKGVNTVIVICAKTLIYGTWTKVELPKHSTIPYETIGWKPVFSHNEKLEIVKKVAKPSLLYVVVNPDAITSDQFENLLSYLKQNGRSKIGWVYDESTSIKNRKAARTKRTIKLSFDAAYKRIMTGTPATESPLDLFSQTEFLRPYLLGFRSYTAMKTRYCNLKLRKFGNRAFTEVVGYRDLDHLHNKLLEFSSFLKLSDIAEIPDQTFKQVAVELTNEQIKHYEELKAMSITFIENNPIEAVNALALMRKLHQVLVGQMKISDNEYISIKNNRLDVLEDLMDDTNGKVLIWSVYRHSTLDILERLQGRALAIRAEQTSAQREETIEKWRTDPNIQGLILNQANAAHGLTLNEAKTAIYFSNDFSLEKRLQSIRRNYRLGQDSKTTVIDLYVPNTLEEGILCSLEEKQEVSNMVMNKDNILSLIKGEITLEKRKWK